MYTALHFEFTTDVHLRLLLRLARGQAVLRAIQSAVQEGDLVLDAGTGTGLLAYFALQAGASHVVAVDRLYLDLAKAIAIENKLDDRMTFIEADLSSLEIPGVTSKFDVITAFMYMNHILLDESRAQMIYQLRQKYGKEGCVCVPNKVRYMARACDYPGRDLMTHKVYMQEMLQLLESTYHVKFKSLVDRAVQEIPAYITCPRYEGSYPWLPGNAFASARFERGEFRSLSQPTFFTIVDYDSPHEMPDYPEEMEIRIDAPGIMNGLIWTQELMFDDIIIWTTESFTPIGNPRIVNPEQTLKLATDIQWRNTHKVYIK